MNKTIEYLKQLRDYADKAINEIKEVKEKVTLKINLVIMAE